MRASYMLEDKYYLDAYLTKNWWPQWYWQTFFPLKYTPKLDFDYLIGSEIAPVAGDIVAYGSPAPEKTRRYVGKLHGDIPPIRLKRQKNEVEINDYNIIKGQSNVPDQAFLDFVYEDVDFVVKGVQARMEWMALQALYQFSLTLDTTSNEPGVITNTTIDFGLAANNKRKIKTGTSTRVWNNGTAANIYPVTDIRNTVEDAEDLGLAFKYLLMSKTVWQAIAVTPEMTQLAILYMGYGMVADSTKTPRPTLDAVNAALKAQQLPEILVINTRVTIEDAQHHLTTTNPWGDTYATFIPDLRLGDFLYGPIAEETNPPEVVIQSKYENILVSKWGDVDPVREVTKGESNCFPAFPLRDQCYRMNVTSYGSTGIE